MPGGDTTMEPEGAFYSVDYIEFLVIGAHTVTWMLVIGSFVIGKPLNTLLSLNPLLILPSLPFLYIFGIMMDSVSQTVLNPFRILIRNSTFNRKEDYLDEYVGYHSSTLYAAYDWRIRRIRIPTSAIFNWILLGIGLLLHFGFSADYTTWFIAVTSVAFALISLFAWIQGFRRAYEFRKNATDVIRREQRPVGA